ncbi:serine/threonine-protein kinase [Archangium sp.]|uniref:serine/threonine-protein kinase n=1 Tax=Archangium sp. TaxID=1872627 RepID=UPI002D74813A|nr:serine/threonine-protein kinase [Archangium sp.]HYO58310.1 serine/threonine-protein kinase [Archangium sp.]
MSFTTIFGAFTCSADLVSEWMTSSALERGADLTRRLAELHFPLEVLRDIASTPPSLKWLVVPLTRSASARRALLEAREIQLLIDGDDATILDVRHLAAALLWLTSYHNQDFERMGLEREQWKTPFIDFISRRYPPEAEQWRALLRPAGPSGGREGAQDADQSTWTARPPLAQGFTLPGSAPQRTEPPVADQDPLVGQRVGEYVVHQRLGSGGMGLVYEGEHVAIGHKVAIKFIRPEHEAGGHGRGLLTEARAASAIRHRGIIDVIGFGYQPGIGEYLVMEYLQGQPLNKLIGRGPLPPTETFGLIGEVLDALSAAHAEGVIHRDLKPSNIFVVRESNGSKYVKVLDFGLAKRSGVPHGTIAQTYSNAIVGTPDYMAPEQALGEAVGPRTDLYAVGVIAFEMLTGRLPFVGRSPMETMAHHLKEPPPVPSSLVALPPGLDELLLRLLAKNPSQRPGSAEEVARELRALAQRLNGSSG